MLVEDDNNLREIYQARLNSEGYETITASDGEEALSIVGREKPDLIILDVMMPKISGFDTLDLLKNSPVTRDIKVIMMTALSQAEDRARAEKLGAQNYLVKSQVTLEDIVKAIKDALEGTSTYPSADAPSADTAETPSVFNSPSTVQDATTPVTPTVPDADATTPVADSSATVVAPTTPETTAETPSETPAIDMSSTVMPSEPVVSSTETPRADAAPTTDSSTTMFTPTTPETTAETPTDTTSETPAIDMSSTVTPVKTDELVLPTTDPTAPATPPVEDVSTPTDSAAPTTDSSTTMFTPTTPETTAETPTDTPSINPQS